MIGATTAGLGTLSRCLRLRRHILSETSFIESDRERRSISEQLLNCFHSDNQERHSQPVCTLLVRQTRSRYIDEVPGQARYLVYVSMWVMFLSSSDRFALNAH